MSSSTRREIGPATVDEFDEDVLVAVVDRLFDLAGRGTRGESGPALGRRLRFVEQVQRRAEAFSVEMITEASRTGAYLDDGHRCAAAWIEAETNESRSSAIAQVRLARLGGRAPQLLDDLRSGRLGVAQARELGRLSANPRLSEHLDGDTIDAFLREAKAQPYRMFCQLTREWEALMDADGTHRGHENAHASRRADIATVGDTTVVSAALGAAQGSTVIEIFHRFVEAEFRADWDEARARVGADGSVSVADLRRTDAQRRADAFVAVFRQAASGAFAADVEPVVNIVVPVEVFEEQLTAMAEDRPARFEECSGRWQFCLTSTGVEVDPAEAVAAALVGQVRRVVMDSAGTVINFGQRVRLFRGSARQAALIQALVQTRRRCLWPGCWQSRLQVDHCQEWRDDGPTDLANAAPLCGYHNRFKARGYRTARDAAGRWRTYRPDGSEIGDRAADRDEATDGRNTAA